MNSGKVSSLESLIFSAKTLGIVEPKTKTKSVNQAIL